MASDWARALQVCLPARIGCDIRAINEHELKLDPVHCSPILVVWGKYDQLFTVEGTLTFGREVPGAEIHLLNASHFALERGNRHHADPAIFLIQRRSR